jgi:hypothetical protein
MRLDNWVGAGVIVCVWLGTFVQVAINVGVGGDCVLPGSRLADVVEILERVTSGGVLPFPLMNTRQRRKLVKATTNIPNPIHANGIRFVRTGGARGGELGAVVC